MKNLSLISFVGVDTRTNLNNIIDFKSDIVCEWGVLFSDSKSQSKHMRYPDYNFCKDFIDFAYSQSVYGSVHLCGDVINRYLKQDQDVMDLCQKASRIQLNLNIDNYCDYDKLTDDILFMISTYGHSIILQQNKSKEKFMKVFLNTVKDRISLLYDGSGGFGREISQVVSPNSGYFTGYAGGIKPENVFKIVELIEDKNPNNIPYYIDMESGIRIDNIFSIDKCKQIIDNLAK